MLFYSLIIYVSILSQVSFAQRACVTPTRARGLCVPYFDCGYVKQQYAQFGQNVPPQFIDFLRRSRCEGEGNSVIHICCDASMVEARTTTTTTTTTTRRPLTNSGEYWSSFDPNGLAVLNSIKCGPQHSNRVSHGNKTDLAEFPWMALLRYENEVQPFQCGGSLITNRYVLTAAHCVVGILDKLVGVRLGEHDINNAPDCQRRGNTNICSPAVEDFGIEQQITHPQYSRHYLLNDIGLLRLDRNVVFKTHIKPICLPIVESAKMPINNEYFIAGWGTTESGTTSNVLLRAKLQHQEREYCQNIFKKVRITENHICAGGDGISDSCKGDSGGPLFYLADYKGIPRYVQFGIVSFGGIVCGSDKTYPGIYANMQELLPWLTEQIA